jgi:hypothetical protein
MHLSYIVVTGKEFESLPSVTEKAMWKVAQSTTNSTVNLCVMRERERERESYDIRVICVVHKCSTTDAPARSETTTTTTHDYANDGVPVGCPPPPNF